MVRTSTFLDVTRFDVAATILGRGRYWTTCYWMEGLLVDTGCAHAAPELVRALGDRPVARIVNTHTHEDHIGGNAPVRDARPGLEILALAGALPILADPAGMQPLHPYRKVMWGMPRPTRGRALADGDVVEAGPLRFQVLHTPGHADDHLCLFERERGWAFTGDLYVGGRDRAIRTDARVWDIVASLKRLAALSPEVLFPGSARIPSNARDALAEKIGHYEELGGRVLDLHRQGVPVPVIARTLMGGPMWIEAITLGHFTRAALVRSYLKDVRGPESGVRDPDPRPQTDLRPPSVRK